MDLRRWLDGPALHPVLHTSVRVQANAAAHCSSWALLEELPAETYFDPWQLRRLQRSGALSHAVLVPDIFQVDLEAPAERSPHGATLLMLGSLRDLPRLHGQDWQLNTTAPLHLRYHGASSTDAAYEDILLPTPELFLRCDHPLHQQPLKFAATRLLARRGARSHSNRQGYSPCPPLSLIGNVWQDICFLQGASAQFQHEVVPAMHGGASAGAWHRVAYAKRVDEDATLSTRVPVGNNRHSPLVLAATGVAMLCATLSITSRLI